MYYVFLLRLRGEEVGNRLSKGKYLCQGGSVVLGSKGFVPCNIAGLIYPGTCRPHLLA